MASEAKDLKTHALVKWSHEDCWDVVKVTDVEDLQLNTKCEVIEVIGQVKPVKFKGKFHDALILDLGEEQNLEKECEKIINSYNKGVNGQAENQENKSIRGTKRGFNRTVSCTKEKKPRPQEHQILAKIRANVQNNVKNKVCCSYRKKYYEAKQQVSDLKKEKDEIKQLLEKHETLNSTLTDALEVQKAAKKLLKTTNKTLCKVGSLYSSCCQTANECGNSLNSDDGIDSILKSPSTPSSAKSVVELIPSTGVFINPQTLHNACSDAAGDGRKLARNLLLALFNQNELVNRSLTGRVSNAFKEKVAKPAVDPVRINAILSFVRQNTQTDLNKVKASLSNKLKEISTLLSKTDAD